MGIIKKIIEMIVKLIKFTIGTLFIIVFAFLWLFSPLSVNASENDNNMVIQDLTSDPNFNINDYSTIANDYSLYVIQLAESKNNTLVVYVYQPSHYSKDLIASHIDISYGFSQNGADLDPHIYELELLSTEGVFDKYLVKGFDVNVDDLYRYYNIVSIYRKFDIDIDNLDDGLIDRKKVYGVGQQWCCYTVNEITHYEMGKFTYLDVESVFCDFIHLRDGFTINDIWLKNNDCYAWLYIFNPKNIICNDGTFKDVNIKHIYNGKLSYDIRKVRELRANGGKNLTYGDWTTEESILTDTDVMTFKGNGLGSKEYSWNRIMSCADYKKALENNKVDISDELNSYLSNNDYYVFSFLETDYMNDGGNVICLDYYEVANTSLLRLNFLDTSNKIYDLGVVSDMISADNKPGGYGGNVFDDFLFSVGNWFEKLFAILGLIVLVIVLMFLSNLLTPFMTILKEIWKAIKYVLSIPFKIVKWVFKRK